MALANCWQNPVDIQADQLRSKTTAFTTSQIAKSDQGTAYNRWAVDPDEPTVAPIRRQSNTSKKRSLATHDPIMPVTSGSQSLLASLPTFMSVFGDGKRDGNAGINASPAHSPSTSISHGTSRAQFVSNRKPSFNPPRSPNFYRRDSNHTFQSESTESSPTTTISTVDSTLTESSPSSSPDSPTSLLPISSLSSSKVATPISDEDMYRGGFPSSPSPNRPGFSRSDSPNKKPRNTKNLSVNTLGANRSSAGSSLPRLASSDTTSRSHALSAPTSPSFVIPVVQPMKRKPSNLGLSITTSENSHKVQQSRSGSEIVPQTPAFSRLSNLRHVEGIGSLPLFSPVGAPEGGMRLPPLGGLSSSNAPKTRPALSLSNNVSIDSNNSSPIVLQTLNHVPEEADHDLPLSREVKSPAYPHGPVCIYPPSVYLYLEPNDIEASEFDVVINVAREVTNPFVNAVEEPKMKDVGVQVDPYSESMEVQSSESTTENLTRSVMESVTESVEEPPSAVSEKSFRSAFEVLPSDGTDCPDTPKPAKDGPEYIHVPWEHNTKVSLELMELCELIDDRVKRGKRVLIHCQCGVSRSASLIIAYGLYKNPNLSDNEAYNAVKERSRWINPNMHFIFELHAFKQMLTEKNRNAPVNRRPGINTGLVRTQTDSAICLNTYPLSAATPLSDEPTSAPLHDIFQRLPQRSSSLEPTPSHFMEMPLSAEITPALPSTTQEIAWSPTDISPGPWGGSLDSQMQLNSPPAPRTALPQKREFEFSSPEPMASVEYQTQGFGLPTEPSLSQTREFQFSSPEPMASVEYQTQGFGFPTEPSLSQKREFNSSSPERMPSAERLAQGFELLAKPSLPPKRESKSGSPEPNPAAKAEGGSTFNLASPSFVPPLRAKSSMPAGFSSIMARRQAPRQLPLRTEFPPQLPSLHTLQIPIDSIMVDAVPETPSLLSPRAAEFTATPFHRTAAGDLAGSSFFEQALLSPKAVERDPRSPATRGEAPITRSIDEML